MRKFGLLTAGAFLWTGAAWAADSGDVSVTIYNSDLALVQDVRTLDLNGGRQKIEFKDVSAAIRPETVTLSSQGVEIVEQNFDFDLLSPDKMMEKAVGQQVKLVRINPGNGKETTETATVLAVNGGVVLRVGDHIEVLRDDSLPTRVIFDKVPDNLRARPTLSVTVDSKAGGARPGTLSYLTSGLSWKADYVALFDEGKSALDLQGWITLTNQSGSSFTNAKTRLVAGDVQTVSNNYSYGGYRPSYNNYPTNRGAGTEGDGGGLGDYHIYPLPERTTIAQNQTKQVSFIEADGVKAQKAYEYRANGFSSAGEPAHVNAVIVFNSGKAAGIGAALPAGTVRVYMRDRDGEPRFIGENAIDHTPQGSTLAIKTGEAFDVTVLPTLTAEAKETKTRTRYSMSYLVRNARPQAATVIIRQSGLGRDGKVIDESIASKRIDSDTLEYAVPVPANGETTLTFTVSAGW